ncbi:MAG: hypothetical protein ABI234_18605 [Ktedonobacteraceae bacterium]
MINGMNPDEEPTQRANPAVQMPTAPLHDDLATLTMASNAANAATQTASFYMAPTEQVAQQTLSAQGYGQFGALGNVSQPQPQPYQSTVPGTPQTGDPAALYAQNAYAYAPQPSQPFSGQPGQPFPSQPGQGPVRRKRPVALLVAIVVIVVLLIGGGTAFALVTIQANASTPTKTLLQFCDGLKTLNAQEMYGTFSTAARAKASLLQVQQTFDSLKNVGLVKLNGCTVGTITQDGSTATSDITIITSVSILQVSISTPVTMPVNLVLENNAWKVNIDPTNVSNLTISSSLPTPSVNQ